MNPLRPVPMPPRIWIRELLARALPALVLTTTVIAAALLWRSLLFVPGAQPDKTERPELSFTSQPADTMPPTTGLHELPRQRPTVAVATNATQRIVQSGQATR